MLPGTQKVFWVPEELISATYSLRLLSSSWGGCDINLYSGCNCMSHGHHRVRVDALKLEIQTSEHLSFMAETGGGGGH